MTSKEKEALGAIHDAIEGTVKRVRKEVFDYTPDEEEGGE